MVDCNAFSLLSLDIHDLALTDKEVTHVLSDDPSAHVDEEDLIWAIIDLDWRESPGAEADLVAGTRYVHKIYCIASVNTSG